MKEALQHSYFLTELDSNHEVLESLQAIKDDLDHIKNDLTIVKKYSLNSLNLTAECLGAIAKSEAVIRKAVFEADEVTVPTAFIIVNQELLPFEEGVELVEISRYE